MHTAKVARAGEAAAAEPPARPVPAKPVEPTNNRQAPRSATELQLSFAPLVKETAPAVVNVYAARKVPSRSPFAGDPFFEQFFGGRFNSRPRIEQSLGSGVIVDASGLIITNNHVIENADEVKVSLADGREFDAQILSKNAQADLAVLKVDAGEKFPTIPLADSDRLEIGDLVLAIGNPFGIGQTVTSGIVSALARTHIGTNDFGYFIQTDAAINPGNSGGALIDMEGRLVGVNTAIFSRSGGSNGIGFAIPSNMVRVFVEAAKGGKEFERPYVGATFAPVTGDIAEAMGMARPAGALIENVAAQSPAEKAGLEPGDVVTAVGDFAIDSPDALAYRLATTGIGKTVTLSVRSSERQRQLTLDLVAAPEVPARERLTLSGPNPFAGAEVENLSPKVAQELNLPADKRGVVVSAIDGRSYAAQIGLQPRDIFVMLNGRKVQSTKALAALLAGDPRGFDFEIERDGQRIRRVLR
ncbi:DegQ family serine endoprotease [Consotaella salsifontis]|uniref:Do/DeqQ family serine protease n=1 Tax=Consotaella salsifontis TaxID=1365950 RepID=A0A1T4R5V5_9HYPH|nr:DegQ family serine endoprotease [Consotaella salsifontis]SKA11275.1 Do/DeqQ family serine protease [Consotaella salsifontis]